MDLRPTHLGYAYQDLLTAIRLVDVALGRASRVIVDTKFFAGDRFDDITTEWRSGERDRLQIKHTDRDRQLSRQTFSGDRRGLRLDLLIGALQQDAKDHPGTGYRITLRDIEPQGSELALVLKPVDTHADPGPCLHGLTSVRMRFEYHALRTHDPWRKMLECVTDEALHQMCDSLIVEVGTPACSLDVRQPGPAEHVLLRRVAEELGAGRPPNRQRTPEDVALALIEAATAARSGNGTVTATDLIPRLDLAVDFGAVRAGHPVDPSVEVGRPDVLDSAVADLNRLAETGGVVVLTGEPGIGKSWLCEQLDQRLRQHKLIVARHHCWLGSGDKQRDQRVLADVVIGSLLGQLEIASPDSIHELRPRYAATVETLSSALSNVRRDHPDRKIALIVDGLDHVTRVLGHVEGGAFRGPIDPARVLVDELAVVDIPAGVVLVLASQSGMHLDVINEAAGVMHIGVPPLNRHETADLTKRLGVIAALGPSTSEYDARRRTELVVDLIHERSRGNTLYATYLCRQACGPDPALVGTTTGEPAVGDPIGRLRDIPASARDLDEYYGYLLAALTTSQRFAVAMLAICDFAVNADELREIFPDVASTLSTALNTVSAIVSQQPSIGGLKIHHESFSRFVRSQATDDEWVSHVRTAAAEWLARRGFYSDARAFRHLPELLVELGRHDELDELIASDFLSRSIAELQPPTAITHTLALAARSAALRQDWPMLVRCVELRRAADTYESEGLPGNIVLYADVLVSLLGAAAVATTLVYDGIPTVSARWGLQLCAAVDKAGAAAPWGAYLQAREDTRESDNVHYGDESDDDVFLAELRAHVRLSDHRPLEQVNEDDPLDDDTVSVAERMARFLNQDGLPPLSRVFDVFLDTLGPDVLLDSVKLLNGPETRAALLLHLAAWSAANTAGALPSPRTLAVAAWACTEVLIDARALLRYGVPVEELRDEVLGVDVAATLHDATEQVLRHPNTNLAGSVRRWLSLIAVAHELDPSAVTRLIVELDGVGFFRAWLRFAVTTVGLDRNLSRGTPSAAAASTTVRVALEQLSKAAQPFTGKPRACDLYSVHAQVHEVLHDAIVFLSNEDLEPALTSLQAISDGTTTSLMGMGGSGPLITTDLLAMLSETVDDAGAVVLHRLVHGLRDEHSRRGSPYPESADFELEMARVSMVAGDLDEARQCWKRAAHYMAAYGSHKDNTIDELLDPLPNLGAADIGESRTRLARLQPLTYLVAKHTDGRGTWASPHDWWRQLADLDPAACADLAADTLLDDAGLPDALVSAAHDQLLAGQAESADPMVLAILRLTAGAAGRHLDRDVSLLNQLHTLPVDDTAGTGGALRVLADSITATYDDQPLMYASDREGPEPTEALREASHRLSGEGATPRPQKEDKDSGSSSLGPNAVTISAFLHAQQRPMLPPGAVGAVLAVRDRSSKAYGDDPSAPRWASDALTNSVGWRLLQVAVDDGTDAAVRLLHRVADEFGAFDDTARLADIAAGLELRRTDDPTAPRWETLAAVAYTLAFTRIRGGGGWLNFAGRDHLDLWENARALDPGAATACLADQVASVVGGKRYGTLGVVQALVAAFADGSSGTDTPGPADAFACWDSAFEVIAGRLPGNVDIGVGRYCPTLSRLPQEEVDVALCRLAVATVAMPDRADRRRALVALSVLLATRPALGQSAAARALSTDLGAGPLTWLLETLRTSLQGALLDEDLAAALTALAVSDMLSVRVAAASCLAIAGRPVPNPPATRPHPALILAMSSSGPSEQPRE